MHDRNSAEISWQKPNQDQNQSRTGYFWWIQLILAANDYFLQFLPKFWAEFGQNVALFQPRLPFLLPKMPDSVVVLVLIRKGATITERIPTKNPPKAVSVTAIFDKHHFLFYGVFNNCLGCLQTAEPKQEVRLRASQFSTMFITATWLTLPMKANSEP